MGRCSHSFVPRLRPPGWRLPPPLPGVFLTSLDITVNVALPEIADSFGAEASAVQWIIILYVGASAAMQLALGAAADAAGLKRMYVFGLAAYTAAVVAIGLSSDLGVVFGLRTLQAVGNGLLMALSPALVTRAFPAEFRGRALGATAALGTLGMVAGSLGGGALVDAFGWRSIFPRARADLRGGYLLLGRLPARAERFGGAALRSGHARRGGAVRRRRVADSRAVAGRQNRVDGLARGGARRGVRRRAVGVLRRRTAPPSARFCACRIRAAFCQLRCRLRWRLRRSPIWACSSTGSYCRFSWWTAWARARARGAPCCY